jgi:phosphoenolpyruvate carboxykinase (GTP)
VRAEETPIGFIPKLEDIDLSGLNLTSGDMEKLLAIDKAEWREELKGHKEFFKIFDKRLPKEIWDEYRALEKRLD